MNILSKFCDKVTLVVNGVEVETKAAAMAVGNWFDDISDDDESEDQENECRVATLIF